MLKDLIEKVPTTMPQIVQILFIVLFTGIGIALLVFAWKMWKKGREDQDRNPLNLEDQQSSATTEEKPPEK